MANTVKGNLIGLDVTGTHPWLSLGDGVHVNGGRKNVIEDNVIASQTGSGVKIWTS